MSVATPTILALDFDGVLCDGLIEYFQTTWRTYCKLWTPANPSPPEDLAPQFYRLRPVVEIGWEMPVLLRAIILGIPEEKILLEWSTIAQRLVAEERLNAAEIGKTVDSVRDEWIATDLEGWLAKHRFYPGVVERVRSLVSSPVKVFIVTTKEGRFVQQLLQQQGIELPRASIIGKEIKRPKYETLRELIALTTGLPASLWFVEDRLKTLQLVQQQADLADVRLYLADWGYNTAAEREAAQHDSSIQLLSLSQFAEDFSAWS